MLDAVLHVLGAELPACVLEAVHDDDHEDVFGAVLLLHSGELLPERVDGDADGVVQRRAARAVVAGHEVVLEDGEVPVLDQALDLVDELVEVEHGLAASLVLRLDEGVEVPLGIVNIFTLESHLGILTLESIGNTICRFRLKLPMP